MPGLRSRDLALIIAVAVLSAIVGCVREVDGGPPGEVLHLQGTAIGSSPENLDFVLVHDLVVDSQGQVYVIGHAEQVTVLDSRGRAIRTIGRQGEGPGEFLGIGSIDLGPGDTLLVYDVQLNRLTAYGPGSGTPAYTVRVRAEFPMFPFTLKSIGDGRLVGLYRLAYGSGTGRERGGEQFELLRLMAGDGALLRDSLLLLRERRHIEVADGRGTTVFMNPFSPRSLIRTASAGRIVTAWTDSLRFRVYTPDGELLRTLDLPETVARRPITNAERDSLIEDYAEDRPLGPALRREIDRLGQTTWPLLQDFALDDRGWIWYALTPARGATEVEWTAVDDRGMERERLTLPAAARLWTVRQRVAYVSETDSLDVPRVVIYDLQPARRGGGAE